MLDLHTDQHKCNFSPGFGLEIKIAKAHFVCVLYVHACAVQD